MLLSRELGGSARGQKHGTRTDASDRSGFLGRGTMNRESQKKKVKGRNNQRDGLKS